jgi:glycine cleavage system H protein
MKKIEDVQLPAELRYSADHEWARMEDGIARVGLTDYAQDQLGDVVYVELPAVGARLAKGAVFATVESVKSVSECFLPIAGEIVEINTPLADDPSILNQSPYGQGWMVRIKPDDLAEVESLMTAEGYRATLKGA